MEILCTSVSAESLWAEQENPTVTFTVQMGAGAVLLGLSSHYCPPTGLSMAHAKYKDTRGGSRLHSTVHAEGLIMRGEKNKRDWFMSQSDMTPGVMTFALRRDPSCSAGPRRSTLRRAAGGEVGAQHRSPLWVWTAG